MYTELNWPLSILQSSNFAILFEGYVFQTLWDVVLKYKYLLSLLCLSNPAKSTDPSSHCIRHGEPVLLPADSTFELSVPTELEPRSVALPSFGLVEQHICVCVLCSVYLCV